MLAYRKLLMVSSLTTLFASTSFAADTIDSAAVLAAHNKARAEIGAPNLKWSTTLQQKAEQWAAELKTNNNCVMKHSGPGENLYWASALKTATSKDASGNWIWQNSVQDVKEADAVGSWVSEKQWYAYPANTCSAPQGKACGHYTQVVGRQPRKLAVGKRFVRIKLKYGFAIIRLRAMLLGKSLIKKV